MKYPGVVLKGRKSRGEVISIALAGDGQDQGPALSGGDHRIRQRRLCRFWRHFIANPDLPERIKLGFPLNPPLPSGSGLLELASCN